MDNEMSYSEMQRKCQQEFLWISFFGITGETCAKGRKERLNACVNRAYRDLSRTLNYRLNTQGYRKSDKKKADAEEAKAFAEAKVKFYREANEKLHEQITSLLHSVSGEGIIDEVKFDEWHEDTCSHLISLADDSGAFDDRGFTYGQAQKWVNMTMKYLFIMGIDNMEKLIPYLHVPIDSFIIKQAAKPRGTEYGLGVKRPPMDWSKLSKDEYLDYQERLRTAIGSTTCPLYWENDAWMHQAEKQD